MKITNSIGWCDDTTNAVTGCDKVSPGCKNCYAQVGTRARVLRSQGIETWGPKGVRHPVAQFAEKLRSLNKKCVCDRCHTAAPIENLGQNCGCYYIGDGVYPRFRRIRLFADSNSDWLDERWPIEVFANFLKEIHDAPNVDMLLLTKRLENFWERLSAAVNNLPSEGDVKMRGFYRWIMSWATGTLMGPPANVWLGVSVENQAMADLRIPQLRDIPAAVRFLSCEPLLEAIDITRQTNPNAFDWVIVGGESGKDRRDCGVEAIVNVAEQCLAAAVPVYVKQDCDFKSGKQGRIPAEIWKLKQFPNMAAVDRRAATVERGVK